MTFGGTSTPGPFSGKIKNRIGTGYSVLDGFGSIDAALAVQLQIQ